MKIPPQIVTVALLFALPLAALPAQSVGGQWETLRRFDGQAGNSFGGCVSGAGDVDGDGFDDTIVGAAWAQPGWRTGAGSAYVYSGATGALLWQFDGQEAYVWLGSSVSGAGDVNADGFDDVIVGSWAASPGGISRAGSAYVYSGATGALLWQFDGQAADNYLGQLVSDAGDVNADGFDDLLVGAPGKLSKTGSASVYSGATGALLYQFDGQAADDWFGNSASAAGDVNADGFDDVIVGASRTNSAFVYSGATGAVLWQFNEQYPSFGNSVSGIGDVDGDGFDDVIIGCNGAIPGGLQRKGIAFIYSGATGALLRQIVVPTTEAWQGMSVSGAGDVDGDGISDVIIGLPVESPGGLKRAGAAYVYSGATGALIRQFNGRAKDDGFGNSVSGAGDVNGDGLSDVIVGASGRASAYIFSLDPFLHLDSHELSASGGSSVELDMAFPTSEAGSRYAVLASTTGTGPTMIGGLQIPLTQDDIFLRILARDVPAPLQGAFGSLDASGQALATLTAGPALSSAVGRTIYFAAVTFDVAPLTGRMSSVVRYLSITP